MLIPEKNNVGAILTKGEGALQPVQAETQEYCFDVQAVDEFFRKQISTQAFAKKIRLHLRESSLVFLENPNDIPNELPTTMAILDTFAEILDPYFTKLDY